MTFKRVDYANLAGRPAVRRLTVDRNDECVARHSVSIPKIQSASRLYLLWSGDPKRKRFMKNKRRNFISILLYFELQRIVIIIYALFVGSACGRIKTEEKENKNCIPSTTNFNEYNNYFFTREILKILFVDRR